MGNLVTGYFQLRPVLAAVSLNSCNVLWDETALGFGFVDGLIGCEIEILDGLEKANCC
jgi:hypothetical protein